ncbi:MAG: hypothetical protein AAFO02_10025 [Bacteroidota bacterium]
MHELLQLALHPFNLVYSILLALIVLYWISVILGAVDMSALDFDFDADVDLDVDVDADTDISVGGWFTAVFHFFHFDRVPFMLIMSIVVLSAWTLSIISNQYWGNYSLGFALAMTAPIILSSFMAAKILTYPLIPLFSAMNQAVAPVEYIGLNCKVKLPPADQKFGQAGVYHQGDELLVNIKSQHELRAGQEAVIVGRTEDKRYWLVEPLEPDG